LAKIEEYLLSYDPTNSVKGFLPPSPLNPKPSQHFIKIVLMTASFEKRLFV
jgi:hypothetical protein